MDAGKCVRLSVQGIVAEEFEQGSMIDVAAGLGQHVDLGALMTELSGVNTGLNFELLNGVNGRKDDVAIEIRVGVIDPVEGVVVEHDALPPRGYRLGGAVATLPGIGLPRLRRECIRVGCECGQVQVFAAVQRQFGDGPVLDHRTNGCRLGLQQVSGRGNFDCVADLAELESDVETDHLLYLYLECFAGCRLETGKLRSQPVKTGRNGWKSVRTRLRGYLVADRVVIDVRQGHRCSGYHRTRRIGHTSRNFTERLSIHTANGRAR